MKTVRLNNWMRWLTIICGLLLFAVLFLPVWSIELSAPQYPEGLILLIYANKLGGSVDIINGLNHYIGMKTLHAEDFIEFTVLPYIIGVLATLTVITGLINRKKIFFALVILFLVTSVVTMADFWRWEYNYGHNLNPDAAIKVPGMAYQPPLIGYKQLLNFSAYSIPASGGWIFIGAGVMLTACAVFSIIQTKKQNKKITNYNRSAIAASLLIFCLVFTSSCNTKAQSIQLGKDNCDYCRMTISDAKFGAEIITSKGKAYKFDDMHCMLSFIKSNKADTINSHFYLVDFTTHQLQVANNMFILKSAALQCPMGGQMAAFTSKENLEAAQKQFNGNAITWNDVLHAE